MLIVQGQIGEYFFEVTGLAYFIPIGEQLHVSFDCGGMYYDGFYLGQMNNYGESDISVIPDNSPMTIWVEEESLTINPTPGSHEYTIYPYGTTSSTYVILTLKVYDVPIITSVKYLGYFDIWTSPAQYLPSGYTLYLNYRYSGSEWIKTTFIANVSHQTRSVTDLYGGLLATPPCGYSFEFQFSARISGVSGEIFGNTFSGVKPPELGDININNIHRQACYPYTIIEIDVDTTIANNPERFAFNIFDPNGLPIYYDSRINDGDKVYLYFSSPARDQELKNGNYLLEVSDNYPINPYCGKEIPFNPGDPIVPLNISSAVPIVFASVAGTDYHIVRYGESSGQVQLGLNLDGRLSKFEIKRSDWPDFTVKAAIKTGSVYTISGLVAGNYLVRCVDTDGCYSNIQSFTLVQPEAFSVSDKVAVDAPCHPDNTDNGTVTNTGNLSFKINGGVPSFTVKVNGSILFSGVSGQLEIPDLSPGNYTINVDNTFQGATFSMTVGTPFLLMTLTESHTNILCKGEETGTITLTANNNSNAINGFVFSSPTAPKEIIASNIVRYSSLASGIYNGTVTDIEGCVAKINNIPVTEPANSLSVSATGSKIAIFGDNTGTIRLVIAGGTPAYSYSLLREGIPYSSGTSTGTTNIYNLPAGTYSAEVTDANGCAAEITGIEVIQPEAPLVITVKSIVDVTCYGYNDGEIVVEASGGWGGYYYQLNKSVINQTGVFTGLVATVSVDSVFVMDSEGVSVGTSVIISEPDELLVDGIWSYNLKCYNDNSGAVKLSVLGGTPDYKISLNNFNWTDSDSIGGLPAYPDRIVYVRDANGCMTQSTFTIMEPEPLLVSTAMIVVDAHCGQSDGSLTAQVGGGTIPYNYKWINTGTGEDLSINDVIAKDVFAGNYLLTVNDANGCTASRSAVVNNVDGPITSLGRLEDASCYGSDDGLVYFSFYGNSLSFPYSLKKLENGQETVVLEGESSYNVEISDLIKGDYLFTVTDDEYCSSTEVFTINEPPPLRITGEVIEPWCHDSYDGFIAINVTGGNGDYTFRWSDNSIEKDLESIPAGDYSVWVMDQKLCNIDTSFTVGAPDPPLVVLTEIEDVVCSGNSLEVDGGEHSSYIWYLNGEVVGTDRYLTVWERGDYILEGTDERGCSNRDTVHIEVSDTPLASFFLLQDTALIGETVQAIDVTWPVPDNIEWLFNPEVTEEVEDYWAANFSANNPGIIYVTLRAWYEGCYSDSTKTITIIDEEWEIPEYLYADNIITSMKAYPNPTDGNFRVAIELKERTDITLTLYNSMGGTIESKKLNIDGYSEIPFNFGKLSPGIYLLVSRTGKESKQLRIVIR